METGAPPVLLFPLASHEAGLRAREIGAALLREQRAVNADVPGEHFEPFLKWFAHDGPVGHVRLFRKGNAIGHRPRVALPRDGAQLVQNRQPFLVGRDDGCKELAAELLPEMIQKILHCAAYAAVIIGRAENEYVCLRDSTGQCGITGLAVGQFGIEEGQGFFAEVEHIHGATGGAELFGEVVDDEPRDGGFIQAAGDSQDVQSVIRHDARLIVAREKVESTLERGRYFQKEMRVDEKSFRWGSIGRRVGALAVLLLGWFGALAADVRLPELKTRSGNYSNVVVTSQTKTDIMITHDRGFGNVKVSDIEDDAALIALGYKSATKQGTTPSDRVSSALAIFTGTNQPLQELMKTPAWARLEELREVKLSSEVMIGIAAGALVLYLFGCFCMKLICEKAGYQPGGLIWLPIFQMIPLFRAAGMSGWWLLACFIPLLNLIAMILWSFKIVRVRGKSALVAIALLLPLLNLFAILYLAFSGSPEPEGKISARR